jgi:hypothetical protein
MMPWLIKVQDARVALTCRPPLSVEILHAQLEVVDEREACADKLAHGPTHGPGGQHHDT